MQSLKVLFVTTFLEPRSNRLAWELVLYTRLDDRLKVPAPDVKNTEGAVTEVLKMLLK